MLKNLSSIVLFIFAWLITSAQNDEFLFRKISPPEGFTYGNIKTICEDANGFIWFGTEHGLYRYNSQKVEKFVHKIGNPNSIPVDNIEKIHKDKKGILWVVTIEGICIFDEEKQSFNTPRLNDVSDNLTKHSFSDLIENSKGELFILRSNKICRINLTDSIIHTIDIKLADKEDFPTFITFDNSDKLWVGTSKGYVYISIGSYHDFHLLCHHRTDWIQSICHDNATFWIGYDTFGADHVNQQGLQINHYSEKGDNTIKIPSDRIRAIVKDSYNRIWIGTYNGIAIVTRNNIQYIKKDFYNNLPHSSIHSFFVDSREGLWIGTWAGGLAFLDRNDNQFLHFNRNQGENSLISSIVSSFTEDNNGTVWLSTEDGGLNKFNREKLEFVSYNATNADIVPTNIKCITAGSENRLWVGTYALGLWQFDPVTRKFHRHSIFKSENINVYAIVEHDKELWLGTFGTGLFNYDLRTGQLRHFETNLTDPTTISSNFVRTLLVDSYGGLWVGTQNGLNY